MLINSSPKASAMIYDNDDNDNDDVNDVLPLHSSDPHHHQHQPLDHIAGDGDTSVTGVDAQHVHAAVNVNNGATDDSGHGHYSPVTAYFFTVNYILGVGVLGMPYAFSKAGYVLSTLCLILVTLAAIASAQWLTDIIARAQIIQAKRDKKKASIVSILSRRFEMTDLCRFFLGAWLARVYSACVIIYLIGSLWSYSSVFASSLASHIPLPFANNGNECDDNSSSCNTLYLYYVLFFACLAVPLTCLDLTEMKLMQIVLALFRFVSLATMMITSIVNIYSFPDSPISSSLPSNSTLSNSTVSLDAGSAPYLSDIQPIVWSGLSIVFPTSIFAQIFHHSVPILSHPVQVASKRTLPTVYSAVLMTTCALYAALGITVGLAFGSTTHQVCTLNWADYSSHQQGDNRPTPGWATFISYMVVLFPPIDIISAYPLNAITLGQTLLTTFIHDSEKIKLRSYIIPFRLLAAVPPIVGACLIKDLSSILQYTGCVGVIIAFIYPCLLQYASIQTWKRVFKERDHDDDYQEQDGEGVHVVEDFDADADADGEGVDDTITIYNSDGTVSSSSIGSLADEVAHIDDYGLTSSSSSSKTKSVKEHLDAGSSVVVGLTDRRRLRSDAWFSYSGRWLSESMPILGAVFTFSAIGLVAVIVLSIVTAN